MSEQLDVKHSAAGVPAPMDVWNSFRRQVDDLFDDFSDGFRTFALGPFVNLERSWSKSACSFASLAVDVAEKDDAYTITAEIPGVSEKEINVSVSDDTLVIKGEKHQEKEENTKTHYLSERSYGSFQRIFALPPWTDASKIEAQFHNGVLTVTVPKSAEAPNARKVDVKAA